MREVSMMTVIAHLDVYQKAGALDPACFDGLPWDEAQLRAYSRRIDWDHYATLIERMSALLPDDDAVARVGDTMDETAPWVNTLVASVVSPAQLYRFWARLLPTVWRGMTMEVTDLPGGRIRIENRIPTSYRGCRALFVATRGAWQTSTARIGLGRALLESSDVGPHHGIYVLQLPQSRTLPARLARHGGLGGLFRMLGDDSREMAEAFDALGRTDARLREYAARLSDVGAAGRALATATDPDAFVDGLVSFLREKLGAGGVRVSVARIDGTDRVRESGDLRGPPARRVEIARDGRRLGSVELRGLDAPFADELVTALVPWIELGAANVRDLADSRETAARARRELDAVAGVVAGAGALWILGADGAVQWANDAGRARLAADPGLLGRAGAGPGSSGVRCPGRRAPAWWSAGKTRRIGSSRAGSRRGG